MYFAGKLQYSQIMLEAVEESSRALPDVLNIHSFGVLNVHSIVQVFWLVYMPDIPPACVQKCGYIPQPFKPQFMYRI